MNDFADEPGRQPEERLRLLDAWSARLLGSDPDFGNRRGGRHVVARESGSDPI